MMNGPEKSDPVIVATKLANKAEQPSAERSVGKPDAAEPVERRAGTKGNAGQQSTRRTQSRASVSQALERIRKVTRERTKERFTTLFHHISVDLREIKESLRRCMHRPIPEQEMAGAGRPRLLQLPRRADQRACTGRLPAPCHRPLAAHAAAA